MKDKVITLISSILTPILIAIIGVWGNHNLEKLRNETSRLAIQVEESKVDLDYGRFDAEQHARMDSIASEFVTKLFAPDERENRAAIATLFVLFPNEARDILSRVLQSVPHEHYERILRPAIQRAESLDVKTGSWIIVIRSDLTLENAQTEANRTKQQGYTPVVIYERGEWFVTTIGNFPTEKHAERAAIPIRGNLREGAFVVNLHSWCPQTVKANGYYQCQGR